MGDAIEFDAVVIGAGVIGLAIANEICDIFDNVIVIEKESDFGQHVSSRHSGVVHSGLYYKPGSLKANLCVEGNKRLYDFAEKNNIEYLNCGKLVVGHNNEDLKKLEKLLKNGEANGVKGLSLLSHQEARKIQPQIKAVQEKYKKDPQKLNKEMMGMYKKHGVNPLGGCLPMLMQMPLLMALFIVFRSTIEFRGQPFIFWVKDLSQPDVVFTLPFNIPIYGSGVAILPLIMGATLFLTMRMSSATMDKSQKPVMYIMNGFFILLFNTFPSGLNLYYTAYNALSFLQQKGIRRKLADA